ncbi:hypothetical protein E2P86_08780 [Sphingobacterium psychroaquaticum]|uniref:sensor histidine kinase n=1 Tax=Sphingobacterium psychroaquaticum TaxID=561061 RepID=UPI00106AD1C6|nr:histidine kinase [Sphingobacterium psychroaquaticum]QBQ41246.1 hypothetical protein E2P86_08780 [Sphingobacterium psychroaquaticum]
MRDIKINSFNSIFFILWFILGSLIWFVDDTNTIYTIQKRLYAIIILLSFISTTYLLCNYLLPKVINQFNLSKIALRVLAISLAQALILWGCQETFHTLKEIGIITFPLDPAEREPLLRLLMSTAPVTLMINIGFTGLKFYFEHNALNEKHMALEKAHLESRLSALQAQVNPHFMFNVLNHIHTLIQKDTEVASEVLLQYADILRYQLEKVEKDTVRLQEEIAFMQNYIEVEKLRWQHTLSVESHWMVEDEQQQVPPLLFITFIENAFKHVARISNGAGFIKIILEQRAGILEFTIENSVTEKEHKDKTSPKLGLHLIQKRLELVYPNKHTLTITRTEKIYSCHLTLELYATTC